MHRSKERRHVIIVGAGPGGLACAMLMASKGYRVTVYEKQPFAGGRTSALQLGEYRFDRGPTFFMMPHLLEELFQAAGRRLEDYVQLAPVDPLYRLQFGDLRFEPSRDSERMKAEMERCFPGSYEQYRRFMKEESVKFAAVQPLLQRPFLSPADMLRGDVWRALPKLHLRDSVYSRLSKYFTDERLKFSFAFQAKYLGMSPWECPGTFTILSYIEHAYGLWHPIGGVNRLTEAMAVVTREHGGEIKLASGVKQVVTRNGAARGIVTDHDELIEADHVVINADFGTAVTSLFDPKDLRTFHPRRAGKWKLSCSTMMLYLGVDREVDMPHHTVLFAEDYAKQVKEMAAGKLSDDPSVYIHNPSKVDPTLAPPGKSAVYALMPVPNLDGETDWSSSEVRLSMRNLMLQRLERESELKDLRYSIEAEQMITPLDWQQSHYVYRGAAFNLAHSIDQMMLFRPRNRFNDVGNCWLVGGGTHPGSGLPTIFESARISAGLIMRQDGVS